MYRIGQPSDDWEIGTTDMTSLRYLETWSIEGEQINQIEEIINIFTHLT